MKKLLPSILVLTALAFVSCKKDYKCECTKTRTLAGSTLITQDGSYTFKEIRTRAETRCNQEESTGTEVAGDFIRTCTIQ
jgi:hypothetical protein